MGKGKYRRRRMQLRRHDQGDDRHEKGQAWLRKKQRQSGAIARMNGGASWQVRTSDGPESAVASRDAELGTRDGADPNSARRPTPLVMRRHVNHVERA